MSSILPSPPAIPASIPPAMHLFLLSEGVVVWNALYLAAELGIADLLADGPRSTEDLARATSTQPRALYRVLRLLASVSVFTETQPEHFALTPAGHLLRTGTPESLRSWVRMAGRPFWHKVYAEALESLRSGQPVFDRAYGVNLFEYLQKDIAAGEIFNAAMSDFSRQVARAVVQAYDFPGVRTLVDVGGGHGTLITAVLRAYPHMQGVLYDLPHVVAGAHKTVAEAGVGARCEIAAGDFFQGVPKGGDAYVLSWIIHDWDRERALTLLRNCRRVIKNQGRLLLLESVVPPGDTLHPSKFVDFVMLIGLGGQERTEEEYAALLCEAGFRLARVVPTVSAMSVLECFPA